jgi:hypothetical protein
MTSIVAESRSRRFSKRALVLVGLAVILVIGATGVAIASIPDSGTGVFHGCVTNSSGALKLIDPSAGQSCTASQTAVSWRSGVNWRGTWAAADTYAANDAVSYKGSSYIALVPNSATKPAGSADWSVLAAKGAAGVQGIQGVQGVQGLQGDPGISHAYAAATSVVHLINDSEVRVATLSLPAGNYSLTAKLEIFTPVADPESIDITCHLYVNFVNGLVNPIDMDTSTFAQPQDEHAETWSLVGTVFYNAPGFAIVACAEDQSPDIAGNVDIGSTASNAVLRADAVGAIG